MYNLNASFNYYMFHGGTNFEFWNGAEDYGAVREALQGQKPQITTSYDYMSPMNEAGDVTDNYKAIANWIKGLSGWPNAPLDTPAPSVSVSQTALFVF